MPRRTSDLIIERLTWLFSADKITPFTIFKKYKAIKTIMEQPNRCTECHRDIGLKEFMEASIGSNAEFVCKICKEKMNWFEE